MDHEFTKTIRKILEEEFGKIGPDIFRQSDLIQYLNVKTRSAGRGSKARSSYGNIYAIYVLIEDYLAHEFDQGGDYSSYEGARFHELFRRQRELPFGSKLQNHALNHRMNQEFKRMRPTCELTPIIRDGETRRYWINEGLLKLEVSGKTINIARAIMRIIDAYVDAKTESFGRFIKDTKSIESFAESDPQKVSEFIEGLLRPEVDARIFEIVSFAVLKGHYSDQSIFWGWEEDAIHEEHLVLYKTGRCNANDGGIDFVMKPLGRFFQVTETVDVHKYFLDIDKIQRYPITFVVKSTKSEEIIREEIEAQAVQRYPVKAIVKRYMDCIEEVINIPALTARLTEALEAGNIQLVIDELVRQAEVEFNVEAEGAAG